MKYVDIIIGIIGGFGLGLLLGSEFTGSLVVITGAILVVISLIAMIVYRMES